MAKHFNTNQRWQYFVDAVFGSKRAEIVSAEGENIQLLATPENREFLQEVLNNPTYIQKSVVHSVEPLKQKEILEETDILHQQFNELTKYRGLDVLNSIFDLGFLEKTFGPQFVQSLVKAEDDVSNKTLHFEVTAMGPFQERMFKLQLYPLQMKNTDFIRSENYH